MRSSLSLYGVALVGLMLGGCRAGGENAGPPPMPVPGDDGQPVSPGRYEDPFVKRQRLAGSTFVEVLEVRARSDGRVFFCTGVTGLNVVDASDPAGMITVARLASGRGSSQFPRCQHLAWDGDFLYMVSRGDEIQTQPFVAMFNAALARPVELDVFTLPGRTFEGIAAGGSRVYLAMHGDGLAVLDRRGERLVLRGVATGLSNAWGVALAGSVVVVADGAGGLATVDVSDPDAPKVLGRIETGGAAQSVEVRDGLAYVAASAGGLVIVDVSDPTAPKVLSRSPTSGTALQVALGKGHAFVANWNDTRVFDIANAAAPRLVATERIATGSAFSRVLGIGAAGDFAFLGEWTGLYSYQLFADRKAPDLLLSDTTLDFGRVPAGAGAARAVIAENRGTAPLVAWSVATDTADFSVDRSSFVLAPGERKALEVTYRSTGAPSRGQLVIHSDDPDERARSVSLVSGRSGAGVGDPAPEIQVALLDGTTWRSTDHRGSIRVLAYFATF